ncbi:MAG: hypothetical protein GY720_07825 [bacterium]|nr:hypothetical protein [bacterium]
MVSGSGVTGRRPHIEAFSSLRTADRALFEGLIDYAGLFPPASLSMADAVAEYRLAREGAYSWMLGRFICSAGRLEELAGLLMTSMSAGEAPWPISVILDGEIGRASVIAHSFDAEMEPAAQVALLEVPLPAEAGDGRSRGAAAQIMEPTVTAAMTVSAVAMPFFEVKLSAQWGHGIRNAIAALAKHRRIIRRPLGAQLRCGGVVPEAFPTPDQVVEFVLACVEHDLPFKATAGLHHPIRHHDSELGVMRHGFVNLLTATAFARAGFDREQLLEVVGETDPAAFALTTAAASWRDHRVRVRDLTRVREQFAAYGSCSFAEPVEDLAALGMISAI